MKLGPLTVGYVFDPHELHALAKTVVGLPADDMVATLLEKLRARYPKHIARETKWVLNNAGGAMGAMTFLHASITEYLIIFGTPIGTEGHTGRFWADDYFMVLDGEQWTFEPGQLERKVYRAGDMHHLARGKARAYRVPERCWALEYARGFIPSMIPFGFADGLTSTLDFPTMVDTLQVYGRGCVGQLAIGKV